MTSDGKVMKSILSEGQLFLNIVLVADVTKQAHHKLQAHIDKWATQDQAAG